MTPEQIQRSAEKTGRLVDNLNDRFAVELAHALKLVVQRMRFVIRRLRRNTDGRVVADQGNLALALALKQDLVDALHTAGYTDLAMRFANDPLDKVAKAVLGTNAQGFVEIGRLDINTLVALKQLRLAELLQVGEEAAIRLWRVVIDGVLGLRRIEDLLDDVTDALDISERRARVVYDTAVSTYSRQVDALNHDGTAEELFFYVGPVDTKVRPFCWERVGKVFRRSDVDKMDNGQLPNVMLTCGGYNCRHQMRRVSALDKELIALVGTGKRHPAVEDRMRTTDQTERRRAA